MTKSPQRDTWGYWTDNPTSPYYMPTTYLDTDIPASPAISSAFGAINREVRTALNMLSHKKVDLRRVIGIELTENEGKVSVVLKLRDSVKPEHASEEQH